MIEIINKYIQYIIYNRYNVQELFHYGNINRKYVQSGSKRECG